jgi:hypothetical protein
MFVIIYNARYGNSFIEPGSFKEIQYKQEVGSFKEAQDLFFSEMKKVDRDRFITGKIYDRKSAPRRLIANIQKIGMIIHYHSGLEIIPMEGTSEKNRSSKKIEGTQKASQ